MTFTIAIPAVAQRTITPVEEKQSILQTKEGKAEAQRLINKDNIDPKMLYSDSIIVIKDKHADDSTRLPKNIYPRLYQLSVGMNLWDPIMRAFGQKYGITDFSVDMSFHNRWIASAEIGLGYAKDNRDDHNFHYSSPLSFYAKLGGQYNFLFRKDHRYQFVVGLRIGWSSFKYSFTDVTVKQDYWNETSTYSVENIKNTSVWGEVLAGLKIKIYKNFGMGWYVRYRNLFSSTKSPHGNPIYIPGFGKRGQNFGASFSIYYDIPFYTQDDISKATELIKKYDELPKKEPKQQ